MDDASTIEAELKKASLAHQAGDLEAALAGYEACLAENPKHPQTGHLMIPQLSSAAEQASRYIESHWTPTPAYYQKPSPNLY